MNEQELRSLVRTAVARRLGAVAPPLHASRALYAGLVNVGDACVIEPAVSCDHCGYCKAHGH